MAPGASPTSPFARVVHVPIDDRSDLPLLHEDHAPQVIVLWWNDQPVGQLVVGAQEDPAAALHEWAASRPAVGPSPPHSTGPATASVVICTRDRPAQLARCLASLPQQSRPPDEVIVVDNASRSAETREVASSAGARYLREDRPGLDFARNTGLVSAGSDIVAFTDDDTELHPRWLERLTAAFDDEQILAVTGLVLPAELDTEAQWMFEESWGFGRGYARRDFGPDFYRSTRARGTPTWEFGAGANMAFRRSVVDAVGLFDERLGAGAAGCSDDSEYWYRIVSGGWTCRYEPSAVVFHHHRPDDARLRDQIFQYMRGHVAALLIQFERTGDPGNLRRAFVTLPRYYALRALARLRGRRISGDQLLGTEVLGAVSGVIYYLRSRLTPRGRIRPRWR